MHKLSYSIREAAEVSGIGRTTIYDLFKTKELGQVKIGNRTLIRRCDLEDYLKRKLAD